MNNSSSEPPELAIQIEIPRGSFIKRGSTGNVDFVSPLPCPFNYGSVPAYIGLDGDLLDAVVLGARMSLGARVRVTVAVRATEIYTTRYQTLPALDWIE